MIQNLINVVVAVGLIVFFVKQWRKTPDYSPVVTDTTPKFYLDGNSQLHIVLMPSTITTENLQGHHTVTAADTEKLVVLLLPISRKVLAGHGVAE